MCAGIKEQIANLHGNTLANNVLALHMVVGAAACSASKVQMPQLAFCK